MKGSDNPFPSILLDEQASAPTTPASGHWRVYAKSDGLYIVDDAGTEVGPFGAGGGSGIAVSGWESADAMTYASADDPTFTVTITGDQSGKYSAGMKIKLTQSTGGTKYFIITAIAVSGDTTLTLYGGTDYNLENEAITNPYYSVVKAPQGFPLDPLKWTVEVKDTTIRTQATPTAGVWYNVGAITISIPIGSWKVMYEASCQSQKSSVASGIRCKLTLSTANNSQSDADFTSAIYANEILGVQFTAHREKHLTLTSKTSYYLNVTTDAASLDNLFIRSDTTPSIIRAVCAFL